MSQPLPKQRKTIEKLGLEYLKNAFDQNVPHSKTVDYYSNCPIKPTYEVGRNYFRVNNKSKIAGYRASEFKHIEDVYNIIHPQDVDFVLNTSIEAISFVNQNMSNPFSCHSKMTFRMIGKGMRVRHFKRESFISGANNKKITRNVSYIEDIGWLSASNRIFELNGDNAEYFDVDIPEIIATKNVLTARECELLRLLARGFQTNNIAKFLHISIHTVKTHRKNMLRKLDAVNTPQLIDLAKDLNLL
jgi:DNA-binding CsgD family transcriptional regulator